jgi:MFS family permease
MGPLCGHLSDRYGARFFSTAGMLVSAGGFIGLMTLPPNFNYVIFAIYILLIGMGMGMFAAPNTTAIMNSVPPEDRGVSSGMRATFQNTANSLSITLIFTVVTIGLAASLPKTLFQGLTQAGISATNASMVAHLPPTAALFAAFLGYNPLATILPAQIIKALPSAAQAELLGKTFFPNLISVPFESGLYVAFSISAFLMVVAAMASLMRGKRYTHGQIDR